MSENHYLEACKSNKGLLSLFALEIGRLHFGIANLMLLLAGVREITMSGLFTAGKSLSLSSRNYAKFNSILYRSTFESKPLSFLQQVKITAWRLPMITLSH
jgi:hypothetical protein